MTIVMRFDDDERKSTGATLRVRQGRFPLRRYSYLHMTVIINAHLDLYGYSYFADYYSIRSY